MSRNQKDDLPSSSQTKKKSTRVSKRKIRRPTRHINTEHSKLSSTSLGESPELNVGSVAYLNNSITKLPRENDELTSDEDLVSDDDDDLVSDDEEFFPYISRLSGTFGELQTESFSLSDENEMLKAFETIILSNSIQNKLLITELFNSHKEFVKNLYRSHALHVTAYIGMVITSLNKISKKLETMSNHSAETSSITSRIETILSDSKTITLSVYNMQNDINELILQSKETENIVTKLIEKESTPKSIPKPVSEYTIEQLIKQCLGNQLSLSKRFDRLETFMKTSRKSEIVENNQQVPKSSKQPPKPPKQSKQKQPSKTNPSSKTSVPKSSKQSPKQKQPSKKQSKPLSLSGISKDESKNETS